MTAETPPLDETFGLPAADDQLTRAAKALGERNYSAHIVDTVGDALELVKELLPRDKEIFTAISETLRHSGIAAAVDESGGFRSVRQRLAEIEGDVETQIKLGAAPDVVVGSVHAVTEDGVMVAVSASGSQLASYAAGARRAVWVVGAQKVVPDLDAALRRVRTYSLPREYARMQEQLGMASYIGKILIMERETFPDRGTVVLVREPIGF